MGAGPLLLEFQHDFAAAIGEPAAGAMSVYRNTILSGCAGALRANYPVVAQLLGDEMFEAVAIEFASQCPPLRPVLALYGARFPDWIERQSWFQDLAYLPQVARIERLYVESLFAADCEPADMSALQDVGDWQGLRLPLHPALRFAWLSAPAMSIWLAHQETPVGDLDFEWRGEGVLVTRPRLKVEAARLSPAAHRFLTGIRLGESVGAAAIATASLYPETDIGSLFASLTKAGAFAASTHRSIS